MNTGTIVQVIGPVVDADFSETGVLPGIYDALEIDFEIDGSSTKKLTLEVQQHLGGGWVRAIAMSSTDGLKRGMADYQYGSPDFGAGWGRDSRAGIQCDWRSGG